MHYCKWFYINCIILFLFFIWIKADLFLHSILNSRTVVIYIYYNWLYAHTYSIFHYLYCKHSHLLWGMEKLCGCSDLRIYPFFEYIKATWVSSKFWKFEDGKIWSRRLDSNGGPPLGWCSAPDRSATMRHPYFIFITAPLSAGRVRRVKSMFYKLLYSRAKKPLFITFKHSYNLWLIIWMHLR